MKYRSFCSPAPGPRQIRNVARRGRQAALFALLAVVLALCQAPRAAAGDAPGWMHVDHCVHTTRKQTQCRCIRKMS